MPIGFSRLLNVIFVSQARYIESVWIAHYYSSDLMSCRIVIMFMLSAKNGANNVWHKYGYINTTDIHLAYNSLVNSTVKALLIDALAGSII